MSSTQLFSNPPAHLRSKNSHAEFTDTLRSKSMRVSTLECNTLVTDNLVDRTGAIIVNNNNILLSETSSQPNPGAGNGVLWVRDDAPNVLVFTNDEGTENVLLTDLEKVLEVSNNAQNQTLSNVTQVDFTAGIEIGTATQSSSTGDNTQIAIGQGATSTAANAIVIGFNSSTDNANSTVIGYNCDVSNVTPNSDGPGAIAIGSEIQLYGGSSIAIGRNIEISSSIAGYKYSDSYPSICIGQNITDGGLRFGGILIGNSISVTTNSNISIGNSATHTSNSRNSINVGHQSTVGTKYSTQIGHNTTSGNNVGGGACIVIGHSAYTVSGTGMSIGYNSGITNTSAFASSLGYRARCSGGFSLAIGKSTNTSGTSSLVVGSNSNTSYNNSTILGASITGRAQSEFATRNFRRISTTKDIVTGGEDFIVRFPTVANDVLHIEGKICAIGTGTDTYMATFENFNFTNKSGTLAKSSSVGTIRQSTSNGAANISLALNISESNVSVDITNTSGVTWRCSCLLEVYSCPLI